VTTPPAEPPPEHVSDHELFAVRAFPDGYVDVAVCWDEMTVEGVVKALRTIADGLEKMPPGTTAVGVVPL
jgi:hypothetical protein